MHAVLVLFRPLPNVGIQNFGMWGMCKLVNAYRSIKKSIANRRVEDWEASNGHTKDTTRLFHGSWHDPVGKHICAQPCRMWNRLRFHLFLQVSQIFQRRKSDANKQDFENKLNLTCQAQSTPKAIGILTKVFCTSGPNSVVPTWMDELSRGQAQSGVNSHRNHTWQQCSVTISEDILTTKYGFNLRQISPISIDNKLHNNKRTLWAQNSVPRMR